MVRDLDWTFHTSRKVIEFSCWCVDCPAINLCFWSVLSLPSGLQTYLTLLVHPKHTPCHDLPVQFLFICKFLLRNNFMQKFFFWNTHPEWTSDSQVFLYFLFIIFFRINLDFFPTFVFITKLQNVLLTQLLYFWRQSNFDFSFEYPIKFSVRVTYRYCSMHV